MLYKGGAVAASVNGLPNVVIPEGFKILQRRIPEGTVVQALDAKTGMDCVFNTLNTLGFITKKQAERYAHMCTMGYTNMEIIELLNVIYKDKLISFPIEFPTPQEMYRQMLVSYKRHNDELFQLENEIKELNIKIKRLTAKIAKTELPEYDDITDLEEAEIKKTQKEQLFQSYLPAFQSYLLELATDKYNTLYQHRLAELKQYLMTMLKPEYGTVFTMNFVESEIGHAVVIWKNSVGELYIVDPQQTTWETFDSYFTRINVSFISLIGSYSKSTGMAELTLNMNNLGFGLRKKKKSSKLKKKSKKSKKSKKKSKKSKKKSKKLKKLK